MLRHEIDHILKYAFESGWNQGVPTGEDARLEKQLAKLVKALQTKLASGKIAGKAFCKAIVEMTFLNGQLSGPNVVPKGRGASIERLTQDLVAVVKTIDFDEETIPDDSLFGSAVQHLKLFEDRMFGDNHVKAVETILLRMQKRPKKANATLKIQVGHSSYFEDVMSEALWGFAEKVRDMLLVSMALEFQGTREMKPMGRFSLSISGQVVGCSFPKVQGNVSTNMEIWLKSRVIERISVSGKTPYKVAKEVEEILLDRGVI